MTTAMLVEDCIDGVEKWKRANVWGADGIHSLIKGKQGTAVAIPIGGFTFEFDGRAKELRKRHWPWVVGIGSTERNAVSVAAFIALRHYVTVTLGRKDLSFRRARVKR